MLLLELGDVGVWIESGEIRVSAVRLRLLLLEPSISCRLWLLLLIPVLRLLLLRISSKRRLRL